MLRLASNNNIPQDGVLNGKPIPRKVRPASVSMAAATPVRNTTRIVDDKFGNACRMIICQSAAPETFACSIKESERSRSISVRIIRAGSAHVVKPIIRIKERIDGFQMAASVNSNNNRGSAMKPEVTAVRILSAGMVILC